MDRLLAYGTAAILFLAPLPFGAVEELWTGVLLVSCFAAGLLWAAWRTGRGLPALPWREPLLLAAALVVAYAVLQMVPVPGGVIETLAPEAAALRHESLSAASAHDSGLPPGASARTYPVSMLPWATRQSALKLCAYAIFALICIDLAGIRKWRLLLAGTLVAGGCAQAAYGLGEYISGRQHIFGYVKKYYVAEATGSFINRNHFAGYLELTIPMALALAIAIVGRSRSAWKGSFLRHLAQLSGREFFGAAVVLLGGVLMASALVSSQSRMGMAGAALSLMVTAAWLTLRGRGRAFAAAFAMVAGMVVIMLAQSRGLTVLSRFFDAANHFSGEYGRSGIWSQVLGMIAAFPLAGSGMGTFGAVFPAFRTLGAGKAIAHAHNEYLEVTAELGALGVLVIIAAVVFLWRRHTVDATERREFGYIGVAAATGLVALAAHSLTDFNLAIPSNALTASALLGILLAWKRRPGPELALNRHTPRPFALRFAAPGLALLVLATLAWMPAGAAGGTSEITAEGEGRPDRDRDDPGGGLAGWIDSDNPARRDERARGTGLAAIDDLRTLVDSAAMGNEPSRDSLGYVERRLDEAIRIASEGLLDYPTSSRAHLLLGRLKAGLCTASTMSGQDRGDCVLPAEVHFRTALRLNPMSAATHALVARFYMQAWPILDGAEREKAMEIIDRAVAMNQGDNELKAAAMAVREARS